LLLVVVAVEVEEAPGNGKGPVENELRRVQVRGAQGVRAPRQRPHLKTSWNRKEIILMRAWMNSNDEDRIAEDLTLLRIVLLWNCASRRKD